MKMLFLLLATLSLSAWAQDPPAPVLTCPPCPQPEVKPGTATYRDDSFGSLMVGYQYLDTWVIGKKSGSYTQIFNKHWSMEFEYATSGRDLEIVGVDLGDINEDRYTLLLKYYIGNSFHVSAGPYMYNIKIKTKGRLEDVSGNQINDTFEYQGYGVGVGFGNRWQTSWGLTYGIDWIRVNSPLKKGKIKQRIVNLDDEDASNVKRTERLFSNLPALTFVGVSIGYTF